MTEEYDTEDEQPSDNMRHMSEEELFETARKYHTMMLEEIPSPSDLVGVNSIILSNLLISSLLCGADMNFVKSLLVSIGVDVEDAANRIRSGMGTIQ